MLDPRSSSGLIETVSIKSASALTLFGEAWALNLIGDRGRAGGWSAPSRNEQERLKLLEQRREELT